MKYIRTKDGIYENLVDISFDNWCKEKISEADTIEELIEYYVVISEHQDIPLIVFKSEIEHYKYCFVNKVKSNNRVLAIYGSFWVGADLLSKAKMNEKGELELL